jgi:transcription initiation factor IIE alpha subunit
MTNKQVKEAFKTAVATQALCPACKNVFGQNHHCRELAEWVKIQSKKYGWEI